MNLDLKLVLTDIDGVWTDGGLYYSETGLPAKKFHTYDSFGVLALQLNGIEVGILTGDDNPIVQRRAARLKIQLVQMGVRDKKQAATHLLSERGLTWQNLAYIGDDVMDLALLKAAHWAATVPNAPSYVQSEVEYVTALRGGQGAFRDFAEHLLRTIGRWEWTLDQIQNIR